MASNLTGDYEAVVQIGVQQINGLIATLHQNRAIPDLSPSFPHSVALRLPLESSWRDQQALSQWFSSEVQSVPPGHAGDAIAFVAAKAPPGVADSVRGSLTALRAAALGSVSRGVSGVIEFQLSTPSITFEDGATSKVTVRVGMRGNYLPDPGTEALPDPIHGDVRINYQIQPMTLANGTKVLRIPAPSHDSEIQFIPAPGTGLSAADVNKLAILIRQIVLKKFQAVDVNLPPDFQFFEFKVLGSGGGQAIALPMQLSGAQAPSGGTQSVTNLFLGSNSFAFAVSGDYLRAQFEPTLQSLRNFKKDVTVPLTGIDFVNPTYHISVTSADLQLQNGAINLIIQAQATTQNIFAPNFNSIAISQRLTLSLNGQGVSLGASDNDLTVTGAPDQVRSEVIAAREQALNPAPPGMPPETEINNALGDAIAKFNGAIEKFDASASARYTGLQISPDGLLLSGSISGKQRNNPVVDFRLSSSGVDFTALNSWIPGGEIERFTWSWRLRDPASAWGFVDMDHVDDDRFVFHKPAGGHGSLPPLPLSDGSPQPPTGSGTPSTGPTVDESSFCLTIDGTQTMPDGSIRRISANSCRVTVPHWSAVLLPGQQAIFGVLWQSNTPADGILEDSTAAHLNMLASCGTTGEPVTNSLIHFSDLKEVALLEALGSVLEVARSKGVSLVVTVVLPAGAFRHRREELEPKLGALGSSFSGPLLVTEDYQGGWTQTFGVKTRPSTYLIDATGAFVWKQENLLDPKALAAALEKHTVPAPPPRTKFLRLNINPGDRVPEAEFKDDGGQVVALRRLRGQPVLLNFWQSWSAPCIRELDRLQKLYEAGDGSGPVIVAVNGGEKQEVLAEMRRQHKLTFILVQDPGQRIALEYGVQCWPTTLSINPDGFADRIQFGMSHEH